MRARDTDDGALAARAGGCRSTERVLRDTILAWPIGA